jgi:hypothetical protein
MICTLTVATGALPPAIVAHSRDEAEFALAPRLPVALLSAPAAALSMGAPWWRALIASARAAHPETPAIDILDCAASAGAALAALRAGCRHLILAAETPAYDAVLAAAAASAAVVLAARPPALTLARGKRSPRAWAEITAWLMTGPAR